eukprot:scaffold10865_cov67-Attheya_sp.AAC.2
MQLHRKGTQTLKLKAVSTMFEVEESDEESIHGKNNKKPLKEKFVEHTYINILWKLPEIQEVHTSSNEDILPTEIWIRGCIVSAGDKDDVPIMLFGYCPGHLSSSLQQLSTLETLHH